MSSKNNAEHSLGLHVLLDLYCNNSIAWQAVFDSFISRDINDLDPTIVYVLAHIPGHPDIYWFNGKGIPPILRSELRNQISNFSESNVVKLFSLIDEDELSFERGTLGQNIEAIISLIDNKEIKLLSIINNLGYPDYMREAAVILFAYYQQESGIGMLKSIASKYPELTWSSELAMQLEQEGCLYLY
ncbi:hypothetical protein [Shewanella baltica]|uniref:hypothetical protein n=1 Tax=Shewanella baltica TaxID=62322 RepID=UPI003D790E17